MQLSKWVQKNLPERGARAWLMRKSGVSFQTIRKALDGDALDDKRTAEKLSEATGGAVSVAELMHIAPPKRGRA